MPEQFVVPQFLDVEAKIIGPITGRQFIILLFMVLGDFVVYRLFLSLVSLLLLALPFSILCILFAFGKVNGQPMHYIVLNMIQTFRRPFLRVWNKDLTDAEVKARLAKPVEAMPVMAPTKKRMQDSRLSELTLVVNTGGVYVPDDESITAGFTNTTPRPLVPKS